MKMGSVMAVQDNSPAQAASIKPVGRIVAPAGDPMTLPDRLRRQAGKTVEVTLQSKKAASPQTAKARLREPTETSPPATWASPMASSSLGVAYRVLNEVEHVEAGSPAAKAGIRPGDVLVNATLIPPPEDVLKKLDFPQKEISLSFKEFPHAWPGLMVVLQSLAPDTQIELTFSREGEELPAQKLTAVEADGWFNANRGFLFQPLTSQLKAKSISEAFALGGEQTLSDLTVVFRTVKKLTTTTDVSPRNLAGPITIFSMALSYADQGTASLLMFLAFLSANLAVLNFLPIPVLDGGLMVFLLYEGIRGKPADERVQAVLSYLGLILILALMVWVLGLDFGPILPLRTVGKISRNRLIGSLKPNPDAGHQPIPMGAADAAVFIAGVGFDAVEHDASGRADTKQLRLPQRAPVDGRRKNPRLSRINVKAVREIETKIRFARVAHPIKAAPRAKLHPFILGKAIDKITIAQLQPIPIAGHKPFFKVVERGVHPESRRRVEQQMAADHGVEPIERLDILRIEPQRPRLRRYLAVQRLDITRRIIIRKKRKGSIAAPAPHHQAVPAAPRTAK